jgi:hypothetical protein
MLLLTPRKGVSMAPVGGAPAGWRVVIFIPAGLSYKKNQGTILRKLA